MVAVDLERPVSLAQVFSSVSSSFSKAATLPAVTAAGGQALPRVASPVSGAHYPVSHWGLTQGAP